MEYTHGEDAVKTVEMTINNLAYYINFVDKAEGSLRDWLQFWEKFYYG